MYELLKDIGAGASPLFAGFIAYLLGLRAYHLQREYELVRRRYLDEGLDAFAADVEHALAVFKHNWQHSLTILKHYRELDVAMRKELLDTGFLDLQMAQFRVRPNYRVGELVGDDAFWKIQQLLFAFVGSANTFFTEDLSGAIRHAIAGGALKIPKGEMVDTYLLECQRLVETANQYHIILAEVQTITSLLEKKRFTLAGVHKLKKRCAVRQSVARLKQAFANKLENSET